LKSYIMDELNVKDVVFTNDTSLVKIVIKPVFSLLGPKLGNDMAKIKKEILALDDAKIKTFLEKGSVEVGGYNITSEELTIVRQFNGDASKMEPSWDDDMLIVLNVELDSALLEEGIAREIINRVQRLRKKCGLKSRDSVEVFYQTTVKDSAVKNAILKRKDLIVERYGSHFFPLDLKPSNLVSIKQETTEVLGEKFELVICRLGLVLNDSSASKKNPS